VKARLGRSGRTRRDDTADIDAIEQLVTTLMSELRNWQEKGEFNMLLARDAEGLMLDHLRRARQEGPLD